MALSLVKVNCVSEYALTTLDQRLKITKSLFFPCGTSLFIKPGLIDLRFAMSKLLNFVLVNLAIKSGRMSGNLSHSTPLRHSQRSCLDPKWRTRGDRRRSWSTQPRWLSGAPISSLSRKRMSLMMKSWAGAGSRELMTVVEHVISIWFNSWLGSLDMKSPCELSWAPVAAILRKVLEYTLFIKPASLSQSDLSSSSWKMQSESIQIYRFCRRLVTSTTC